MCHRRKVKCVREEPGAPCVRCRKAGIECKSSSKEGWQENRVEWKRRKEEAETIMGDSGKGRSYSNRATTNRYGGRPCNEPGCTLKLLHGGKHVFRE